VQPSLAARLPFEMFDGVGHVNLIASQAGGPQAFVEDATGGPNEWLTLQIFLIPGDFADKHQAGTGRAAAEDGLGGTLVEFAAVAAARGFVERAERQMRRQEIGGGCCGRFRQGDASV